MLALLGLGILSACDAPRILERDPKLELGADPSTKRPESELLRQVEKIRGRLDKEDKPIGIVVGLGNLYFENGRYPDAIDWYRQGIEQSAKPLRRWRALDPKAKANASSAPEACATRPDAKSFALALKTADALRPKAQAACLRRALGLVAGALAKRGSAWAVLEQIGRGLTDLEVALGITPDDPEALFLYGAVVFNGRKEGDRGERTQRAIQRWTHFLEVAPTHPRAAQVRGALQNLQRELTPPAPKTAVAAEQAALASAREAQGVGAAKGLDPALSVGLPPALLMVEERLAAGDPGGALAITYQFLKMAPEQSTALTLQARALMASGRGAQAEAPARLAIKKGRTGRSLQALALWEANWGKHPKLARALYQEALEEDPGFAKAVGVPKALEALNTIKAP